LASPKFDDIGQYLAAQPTETRVKLDAVRAAIRRAVPRATEAISYQIPAFRIDGRIFIFFAGWKKHYSLYPVSEGLLKEFGAELVPYEISKGTIRFPLAEPVPEDLIFRIAAFKAEETLARAPKKKSK
jgi:uncharacterized protein YdhG (YjbR/CyaY superfamily)